jgi:hypothetical protein
MMNIRWHRMFKREELLGYATAILAVSIAVLGLLQMETRWRDSAPVSLFLVAVIISAWVGGTKPGLLATALSVLGFNHYVLEQDTSATSGVEVVRMLALVVVAAYVVWVTATERGAADSIRRAHDELRRNNATLREENLERERAEDAVRASQQLLKQVLATLPVGVAVTDRSGNIVLANAVAKQIWGADPVVSGPQRWARSRGYWHDSGEAITEWASVRALSDGKTTLNELLDIEAFNGERKTIQNSSAPILDAEGKIVGAVIVNEDVTERVCANDALRESANRLQHLSRRLLTVQEEERRHLSRELHDDFGQLLTALSLHLYAVKSLAGAAAQSRLDECMAVLKDAIAQVRLLAIELRPTMLDTAGLDSTLRWLAEQHQQRTGIAIQVAGQVRDVPGDVAIAGFRVVQEALTNIVRHARAHRVWIELSQRAEALELVVRDDGLGFDVAAALERATNGGHLGLLGMRERAQVLGGKLQIDSEPGQGTRIQISLPCARPIA